MKKIFTTLFIILGSYVLTSAQQKGSVEFGADVGLNTSYLYSSISSSDIILGLNAGLSADYYFSRSWSIKIKAIYDQKGYGGGNSQVGDGPVNNNVDFRFNYITIPVTANWHFGRTNNWYLDFGPYIGFLTSAKETDNNLDVSSAVNNIDAGLALGIGLKIPISNHQKFFIEYDGQSGATNAYNDSYNKVQNLRESINIGIDF
jgi:outer membrane protein W